MVALFTPKPTSLSSLIPDQPLKSTVTILMIDHSEQDRCTYADYLQADETTHYHLLMADSLEAGQAIWRLQQPDGWCSESVETSLNETPKFKAIDK